MHSRKSLFMEVRSNLFPSVVTVAFVLTLSQPLRAQESPGPQAAQRGVSNTPIPKEQARVKAVPVTVLDYTYLVKEGDGKAQRARREVGDILSVEDTRISNGALGGEISAMGSPIETSSKQLPSVPRLVESTQAPILSSSFETIDFDGDASNHLSGGSVTYHIPPDPSGAAGPSRVVCIVNTSIEWYTKAGALANSQRLGTNAGGSIVESFFEALSPANNLFDPKVIYDQYASRFVVVALEKVDLGAGSVDNVSRILVAVSDDSDPTGTWYAIAISVKDTISGVAHWADYPGLAVDDKAVYITNNMFPFGGGVMGGARLWIVHKGLVGGFYAGSAATVSIHNPPGLTGVSATTMQPAHMFGTPPGTTGTFLAMYSGLSGGGIESIRIIRVDDPVVSPAFSVQTISVGDIDATASAVPGAPQKDSTVLIDAGDRRSLHAVWRSDALWFTATISPSSGTDAGQATAHWFKINTTTLSSLALSDQGNVGGEDIAASTYTFYPSIAVDASGNMGIGFAASASSIYPGAYFSGRLSTHAAGTTVGSGVLRAGVAAYVRKFGGSRNRWGDYSGMSLDPTDGSFWAFNEFAMSRGTLLGSYPGQDGRWRTAFGNFTAADALPIQLASMSANVIRENDVEVSWQTVSETNNYGFEIYRTRIHSGSSEGSPQSAIHNPQWAKVAFVDGHGTTLTPHSYSYVDRSVSFGKYHYRIKQIDLDGKSKTYPEIEVNVGSVPGKLVLAQNYPNPFNPSTVIEFAIPVSGFTTMKVFNVLGQEVATLFEGMADAGKIYATRFTASSLPSGLYFYRLKTSDKVETKRMLLLK